MQSGQCSITQHELGFNVVETMVENHTMSQALLAAAAPLSVPLCGLGSRKQKYYLKFLAFIVFCEQKYIFSTPFQNIHV